MKNGIIITIKEPVLPAQLEVVEDALRDVLEREGIRATIDDQITGNITQTRNQRKG